MKISDSVSMFTRLLSTMKQLRPIPFMSICIFMATGPYTQMRLHNDGESWGNWQAIQTNVKNWKLRNAIGTRTVYMEIKNSLGTVRSSQDNIEYLGPAAIDSRQAIAGLEVNLYPNPATKNSVIMIYSDTKRKLSVGLYDLYGKKIVSIFSGETSAMSPLTFNWPEFGKYKRHLSVKNRI